MFKWDNVTDLLWPEAMVALGVGAAHVLARGADAKMGWEKVFRRIQDPLHVILLGLGVYGVGAGKARDASLALILADLPLVSESITATVWEKIAGGRTLRSRRELKGRELAAREIEQAVDLAIRTLQAGQGHQGGGIPVKEEVGAYSL